MCMPKINKQGLSNSHGFSLIELMVTIAIGGILFSIAIGAWGSMRDNTRVDSAKEHIVSILQQARLKALSSGVDQVVDVRSQTDIINAFGKNTDFSLDKVSIQKFVCTGCVATNPASDTITFTRRGTSNNKNILVTSAGSNRQFIIMVNNVTGRVDVRTKCVSPTCL